MRRPTALAALALLVVAHGCVISRYEHPWFTAHDLGDGNGPEISVFAKPTREFAHVPGLWGWDVHRPPTDLRITLTDDDAAYVSVALQSVRLDYADGEIAELDARRTAEFLGTFSPEVREAILEFSDAIDRAKDGSLVMTGVLTRSDGTLQPFQSTHHFKIDSESHVWFYYYALAMS